MNAKLRQFDWILLAAVALLLVLSVSVIYATTISKGQAGTDGIQQGVFALLGLGVLAVVGMSDYRMFRRAASVLYLLMVLSLILVKFVGVTILGATRWIDIGFFQFQPSEFAKVIMVIVLAKVFADHQQSLGTRTFFVSLGYTLVPVVLVLSQPDLGTALVILATWVGMAIASGLPKKLFAGLLVAGVALLPLLWNVVFKEYQKRRVMVFLDPTNDPLGAGYNVKQAQIAVGSGGLWGQALGQGTQSQLNFLPVQHTDFIFAVLAEELGFAGGLFVVALLGIVAVRALQISGHAKDFFGYQLAIGVMTIILFQSLINIGMNTGIMPVTGIPLPFVSYGGSSILMLLFAVGILQSVHTRREGRMGARSSSPIVVG